MGTMRPIRDDPHGKFVGPDVKLVGEDLPADRIDLRHELE